MTDLEIAHTIQLKPIVDVAKQLGISADDLELYGKYKAKLPLSLIDEEKMKGKKLILVTAITPTPAGEGKTTVSIGLAQGLNRIGKKTVVVLREPSLGPVFGIKGGATGGGYSQVLPMEDINLHFTGDISAVEKAHNLLAALIDNNLHSYKRTLGLDPRKIMWKRVMDMNDRSLRKINIGLGGSDQGMPRESGFNITAASEVMAILCLSQSIEDLKQRLGNILVGFTFDNKPVFARDLNAQGAMAVLLKDAIKPNLVQTIEGNPAILHGGPFANIAQGTNSILATKMGLTLGDYVVTEAGFASDLGAEKFMHIKMRAAGLKPNTAVVVATIRALKYHGGVSLKELNTPNAEAVKAGLANLDKHIENIALFNLRPVVAINKFTNDSPEEIQAIIDHCKSMKVAVAVADVWGKGGAGTEELAKIVSDTAAECHDCFKPLYDDHNTIEEKIDIIAKKIYGAASVELSIQAHKEIAKYKAIGFDKLPICMAKTQKSLSDDEKLIGRPTDFVVHIREVEIATGAGFLIPIAGNIMRMPGLPLTPAAESIDIDNEGNITGLF